MQTKCRFRFYLLIDLFIIFEIKKWQKRCRRNKFLIYNVLSKLAVAFILIIIIPINGGDSPWAGYLEPCKVKKCWDQTSPTAPDSPCRPGGAAPCAPWTSCIRKGWKGCQGYWQVCNIWWHKQPFRALPQDSGGGGFPLALLLRRSIQIFQGTSSSTCNPFFFPPVKFWSRAVVLAPGMTSCMSLGLFWLSKH